MIAVAATNWRDELTGYSNRGEGLALSAPGGEMLWNATNESGILSSVVGGYAYYHGTSMAAPQVTGTAAVIASVSGIRGAELRERLVTTADDLGPAGYDTAYGFGRLNIYRAITGETIMEVGNEPGDVADPLCVPRGSSGKCR